MRTHWLAMGWLGLIALSAPPTPSAIAAGYPQKPVTIIMPSGAGGGPDVIARIVADRLTHAWGQQVLVVNRPGAGGLFAARAAAAAAPDGYTLYMPISSTFVVLPETQPQMSVDLARDIVPIGLIGEQPMVISVHPSLGVDTLQDLISLARKRPKELLFGAGRGFLPHLTGEMFQDRAGIKFEFIPYPSSAGAMQDALRGTVTVFIESLSALAGPIQAGSLKPLAVASATRLPNFPDLPTVSEAVPGLGAFEARGWFALMVPANTPADIVQSINRDLHAVLDDAALRQTFAGFGTYARSLSPRETADFIRREQDLWRPVVRKVNAASH